MAIKPSSAKAKGRRLQQWVCKKISELLGLPFGPDEAIASREMGQAGTDIRLVGEVKKLFPYSVECKAQEKMFVPAWVKQARENQIYGTNWLLVTKRNREKPLVIMEFDTFFKLLKSKYCGN